MPVVSLWLVHSEIILCSIIEVMACTIAVWQIIIISWALNYCCSYARETPIATTICDKNVYSLASFNWFHGKLSVLYLVKLLNCNSSHIITLELQRPYTMLFLNLRCRSVLVMLRHFIAFTCFWSCIVHIMWFFNTVELLQTNYYQWQLLLAVAIVVVASGIESLTALLPHYF
jgi:hypothetical protein